MSQRQNLWAPWRIGYIRQAADEPAPECFICHDLAHPEKDRENLVLLRTERSVALLNRFPYNNGHLLVAPQRHVADLDDLADEDLLDLMQTTRRLKWALGRALSPHGYNVGINLGRCAGAGLPGHLHVHVVPRWNGDTNFVSVCAGVDVISQSLDELWTELRAVLQGPSDGGPAPEA